MMVMGIALVLVRGDSSSFEVGKTLRGIVIDWSDAEASGLRKAATIQQ